MPTRFEDPDVLTTPREKNNQLASLLHGYQGDSEIEKVEREEPANAGEKGAWLLHYKAGG